MRGLVREHSGSVLRWVRRYADGPDEAEDLHQEVWKRVLERRSTYRGDGSFRGWLHRVARGVATDRVRARESRRRRQGRSRQEAMGSSGRGPGGDAPDPHARIDDERRLRRAREALAGLPARQRETVELRLLDGMSTRETARAMDCAEGTVKAALSQALNNLRRALAQADESNETPDEESRRSRGGARR
jgi:RNA polymerase sigma-70 factor (ECF subfamily)